MTSSAERLTQVVLANRARSAGHRSTPSSTPARIHRRPGSRRHFDRGAEALFRLFSPDSPSSLWSSCALFATDGSGRANTEGARLILPTASRARYSDAHPDDYGDLSRRRFAPPAAAPRQRPFLHNADALKGTAFGF
jgi:hypothetical protein